MLKPLVFPRDVFKAIKKAGHRRPSIKGILCPTQAALDRALSDGWFATIDEAIAAFIAPAIPAPTAAEAPDLGSVGDDASPAPLSRAELEAEAKRLGVKLDSRNSDERLAGRIMEAHASKDASDADAMDAVAFQRSNS